MRKLLLMIALFTPFIALVSCNNSKQNAMQDEACVFPNITDQGVEPFFLKSSMLDIPAKGSFYDSIIINKYYDWDEVSGECYGRGDTESRFKYYYDMLEGNVIVKKCYGVAIIIKNGDTIMTVGFDDNAKITDVTVLSDKFQMGNGLHVGMWAADLINDFDARFVTQNSWVYCDGCSRDGYSCGLSDIVIIDVPSLPKHIIVFSECNKTIADFMDDKLLTFNDTKIDASLHHNHVYTLPSEVVSDNTVSKIKIRNTAFDCYYEGYKEF